MAGSTDLASIAMGDGARDIVHLSAYSDITENTVHSKLYVKEAWAS